MGVSSSKPRQIETKWFNEFEANLPSLEGKTVVITGTTSGTGYIVARTAIRKGADNILLLNRPSERASKAEARLKEEANVKNVETIPCDLQDLDSVRKAAEIIKSKYDSVDILCNNAGVMALEDIATKDGYDVQMQTNHLSHFLLTKELYPLLKKAAALRGEARVANHSSSARKYGGPLEEKYFGKNGGNLGGNSASVIFQGARWVRYHESKLANTVFTKALADRLGPNSKIIATSAEPGLAATNLQVSTNQNGGMGSSMWIMRFAQSAEDGAMPICSACFKPDAKSGKIWEPSQTGGMRGPAVENEMEKLSTTESFRDLLWKASEEACGSFDLP
jgi:NAD(P)-dependent dehydrogenase (short-subunit alcohol dehydrogenase family)